MMDLWLFSGTKLRTKFDTIQSIRIYAYAAREGEMETLQEKREVFIQEHNEAAK